MFYADFVLSKKGPLARIWLAAHWDKKLTKNQIFETNIESSIERILKPKVKLALRTSGHLMLGVVRIYSRKTKYLLADCNEAFVKIKMAFRPGMVDLPEDHREAAVNAVTLPEVFHDFDSAIPDLNDVDIEAHFQVNQSRADEITMREDYGTVTSLQDEFSLNFDSANAFLGHGFDHNDPSKDSRDLNYGNSVRDVSEANSVRDINEASVGAVPILDGADMSEKHLDRPSTSDVSGVLQIPGSVDAAKVDDFGPVTGEFLGLFEDPEVNLVDHNSLQIDDSMHVDQPVPSTSKMSPFSSPKNQLDVGRPLNDDDDDDFDDHFIPPSPGAGSDGSRPPSPIAPTGLREAATVAPIASSSQEHFVMPAVAEQAAAQTEMQPADGSLHQHVDGIEQNEANQNGEQTTLLQNEEESFALAPVDASALRGLPKTKRKRKLIVDEVKNISGEEMKAQLSDTSDIVITLDLAPPTKRLMHWKETGGVEKLFALPGKNIPSTALFKNYQRHLTSKPTANDEGTEDNHSDGIRDNQDLLDMNPPPPPAAAPSRRGRKRKQAVIDEEPLLATEAAVTEDVSKKVRLTPPQNVEGEIASAVPEMIDGQIPDSNQPSFRQDVSSSDIARLTPIRTSDSNQPADLIHPLQSGSPLTAVIGPEENSIIQPLCSGDEQDVIEGNIDSSLLNRNSTAGINAGGGITPYHDPEPDYDNPLSVGPPVDEREQQGVDETIEQFEERILNKRAYDNPLSVEPPVDEREQQGVDETIEQFEERILNKRAGQLYSKIREKIIREEETTFDDLIKRDSRKQIAQRFYSLLVLKKARVIELTQTKPYDTILLTKGSNFDDPKL